MTAAQVRIFVNQHNLTFPNLIDDGVWDGYSNQYYQVNVVLDQTSTIQYIEEFAYSEGAIISTILDLLEIECIDEDEDLYSPEGGECGPVDCDDTDPSVNPGQEEVPGNGIDDNCDGEIDEGCFIGAVM